MAETTDVEAARPLTTFALFAYNQEGYVREAIEAAFAQTYSPLEIILSDDCSSDSTFAIMQEMAASYSGPHRVIARQSPHNRGLLPHVLDVARMAQGKYMVVAAGDDISLPSRCEKLVELFEREDADFCWSAYEALDENGMEVRAFTEDFDPEAPIYNLTIQRIPGATAGYRLANFVHIPKIDQRIFYEDTFLEIFALIRGLKVAHSLEILMQYRVLPDSLSLRLSQDVEIAETKLATHLGRQAETAALAIDTFTTPKMLAQRPRLAHFRRCADFYQRASAWRTMTVMERLALWVEAPNAKAMKWFAPRALLGWHVLIALKTLRLRFRSR
jgi:glycosyltransferase involved in cell wall biosynthesis